MIAAAHTSSEAVRHLDLGVADASPCGAGRMEFGRVYALNTSCPTIRFPLLGSLVGNAIDAGIPCSVILRSRVEEYLEQLNTPAKIDLQQSFAHRSLNIYLMQNDFQKKLFQSGARRMLEEMSKFGVTEDSLVIFEHATDLLNLNDMSLARSQLDAIADWSREHRVATLIVFANTQDRRLISPRALLDSMSGLAEFEDDRDGLALSFPYWRSCGQVATGERFLLQLNSDGIHSQRGSAAPAAPREAAPAIQSSQKSFAHTTKPHMAAAQPQRVEPAVSRANSSFHTGLRDFEGRRELNNSQPLRPLAATRARRRQPS
jgi:hypothetical protein